MKRKIYLVGGAVRDKLLGLPVKERDWVVVGAAPEEMIEEGFRPVGKEFPVFLHPRTHEEYALARTERKVGPGYKGFVFHAAPDVTLEEDLKRRDLTINAMAMTPEGEIIDPFGGLEDLRRGILRHVSPAFAEDPLRILRVARFAARFGFEVAEETLELMEEMVEAGEVEALVPERVWKEIEKALAEGLPGRFFEVLRACGALSRLFPEIHRLFGVPQPRRHHPEIDVGIHTLMVLTRASTLSEDPKVRFAALCHDLGKGLTLPSAWPSHKGHEEKGLALVEGLCSRYKAPNAYRRLALWVARYHGDAHRAFELRPQTLVKILNAIDALHHPERLEQFLTACQADYQGRPWFEERPYRQGQVFRKAREAAASVTSEAFREKGLKGPALGQAIHRARLAAIAEVLRIGEEEGPQGEAVEDEGPES